MTYNMTVVSEIINEKKTAFIRLQTIIPEDQNTYLVIEGYKFKMVNEFEYTWALSLQLKKIY